MPTDEDDKLSPVAQAFMRAGAGALWSSLVNVIELCPKADQRGLTKEAFSRLEAGEDKAEIIRDLVSLVSSGRLSKQVEKTEAQGARKEKYRKQRRKPRAPVYKPTDKKAPWIDRAFQISNAEDLDFEHAYRKMEIHLFKAAENKRPLRRGPFAGLEPVYNRSGGPPALRTLRRMKNNLKTKYS